MRRSVNVLLVLFILMFSMSAFSRQNDEVKNTCEVSGGQWTESANGWACCWADWGCYGCINGVCKIKCHNERCRKANGTVRPGPGLRSIKGLAPAEHKAPIIPKIKKNKR